MPTTDVRSPGGWLQLYGVRIAKGLVIGAIGLAAGINFAGPAGGPGIVLQQNGVNRLQRFTFPCTNTGGLELTAGAGAKYDTCISTSPITTTGAIAGISVECGGVPKPFVYDVSFVKALNTGTGTAITNLNSLTAGSGSFVGVNPNIVWNPADYLKLGTRTVVPATSGNDCVVGVDMYDKYGS